MRQKLFLICGLLAFALVACAQDDPGTPPPLPGEPHAGFYFPTGLAYVPDANGGPGFLYVVSSDFDLRYSHGTLASINLASIPLPAEVGATAVQVDDPHIAQQIDIDVFGGPLAVYAPPGHTPNARRLFVGGRQADTLDAIDTDGELLRCARDSSSSDCSASAISLGTQLTDTYRPVIVGNQVFVGHLSGKDDPTGSNEKLVSAVARLDADTVDPASLVIQPLGAPDTNVGSEAVDGMVGLGDTLLIAGRPIAGTQVAFNGAPLRTVGLSHFGDASAANVAVLAGAEVNLRDVRAMALSTDRARLFMSTRVPSALVTLDVTPDVNGQPRFQVLGVAQLPAGASEMTVISRGPGRKDLVAVSCQDANAVAIYDDEIGRVVASVRGVGEQPFGIASGPRVAQDGTVLPGARLYVAGFGRGDVALADLPNLDDPKSAQVLVTLGPNQNCLSDNLDARPPECPK